MTGSAASMQHQVEAELHERQNEPSFIQALPSTTASEPLLTTKSPVHTGPNVVSPITAVPFPTSLRPMGTFGVPAIPASLSTTGISNSNENGHGNGNGNGNGHGNGHGNGNGNGNGNENNHNGHNSNGNNNYQPSTLPFLPTPQPSLQPLPPAAPSDGPSPNSSNSLTPAASQPSAAPDPVASTQTTQAEIGTTPVFGGVPSAVPDLPVTAVFLALFLAGAGAHGWRYREQSKMRHPLLLTALVLSFCLVRVLTCIGRLVWAGSGPAQVASSSSIGVVLLVVISENIG